MRWTRMKIPYRLPFRNLYRHHFVLTMCEVFVQPYELAYSDLLLMAEEEWEEMERLNIVMEDVMETFGHLGPGLLTVKGIPNSTILQRSLLLLSHELALLPPEARNLILKEHGLGSDVPLKDPDRPVSSFVMQLELAKASVPGSTYSMSNNISGILKEVGACMMDLGLRLARVCDRAMGAAVLEQSMLESSSAKARLIHYHSSAAQNSGSGKEVDTPLSLWQQWHYDYGIFTVLTAPLFTPPDGSETAGCLPGYGSCLQILHPGKGGVYMVQVEPGSFIVQVGEAAGILSGGRLCATLHSVSRPCGGGYRGMSRDTFAVFLHPAWTKTLTLSGGRPQCSGGENAVEGSFQEIEKMVPSLRSRLTDGMTFAEFSRRTTKLYYGNNNNTCNTEHV